MAMATSGTGEKSVVVGRKFEYEIPDGGEWRAGEVVIKPTFIQKEDMWQLAVKQAADGSYCLECQLQLVTHSNTTIKRARICLFANGQPVKLFPTASFVQSGEMSEVLLFWSDNTKKEKIVVEVMENLELTKAAQLPIGPPKSQRFAEELLKWFNSDDFGDVTIVAKDGMKFRCHRDILSTHSDMFCFELEGAKEDVLNIGDYEGEIVAAMLQHIYINECGEIGPIADQLYVAADHYQLYRLTHLCESQLAANLSPKSVIKTYRFAKLHHLDNLLANCVDFLDTNKAELPVGDLVAEAFKEGMEVE